jgi:hypothetical protein
MRSHLLALILFSGLVSGIFALVLRPDTRSRVRFALLVFAAFVGSALAVGWLMYPFPR